MSTHTFMLDDAALPTEDLTPTTLCATTTVGTCTHTDHSPTLKVVPLSVAASDLPTLLWAVTVTVYCVP